MKFDKVKIGNIADFINGYAFKPSDWEETGTNIIRIQNLTNPDKPYNSTTKVIPNKYVVQKGDILVSWSATIKVFEWTEQDAYLNQHIFKVVYNKKKVSKEYFKVALKKTINDLIKLSHGSTMKHIVKRDFEKHKIPLPALDDQIRIANILSRAEALIDKRKESIKLLDELLTSTFLEMFGDPVSNPKGWDVEKVIDLCDNCIVPGRDKPKSFTGNMPWITTDDLVDRWKTYISKKGFGLSEQEIKLVKAKIIPKNSVIITCVGELGICSIAGRDFIMNQQLHAFICSKKIANIFLMYALHFQKKYMHKRASTTTVPYMNKTICNSIPVIIPPLPLQNKFAEIVKKVESIKSKYEQSLKELENLYNSLSQRAFKGEL